MNDRVTCEAVMAAFVDTDQLGNRLGNPGCDDRHRVF